MDINQYLVLIDGKDRTRDVKSVRLDSGGSSGEVRFWSAPFSGPAEREDGWFPSVAARSVRGEADLEGRIVTAGGERLFPVDRVLDFGDYCRVISGRRSMVFPKSEVAFAEDCLTRPEIRELFNYFKEAAAAVGVVTSGGVNILLRQYEKIQDAADDTALASYLCPDLAPRELRDFWDPPALIYPFGLNLSQREAVENAFSSQVSIIQGPPGTGKTQTILNIVANAVYSGQTVAVVSNNNAAVENVLEKLEKKDLAFLAARLGSEKNKERFLADQPGRYPDMAGWALPEERTEELKGAVDRLTEELCGMLKVQNRIAAIRGELLEIRPEYHYFRKYRAAGLRRQGVDGPCVPAQKFGALWSRIRRCYMRGDQEQMKAAQEEAAGLCGSDALLTMPPLELISFLQNEFYLARMRELWGEKAALEAQLAAGNFEAKGRELSQKSLRLVRARIARRYGGQGKRQIFESKDLYFRHQAFNKEYPVVLSTTHMLKGTLHPQHVYDCLIIDEASQVDLTTGVLALSCAKNVVIVGDLQQLPNVLEQEKKQRAEEIWARCAFDECYNVSSQSLLSSAVQRWGDQAPAVLLREHYRCHPRIIGFCNQKFYGGELIALTEDWGETDVLNLYRTAPGAVRHVNRNQIEAIQNKILPALRQRGYQSIGIIAPYGDQVRAISAQAGRGCTVDTVHKFQGREEEAVVLSSVDDVIGPFVDDGNMLNVAVSRAVRSLSVVISRGACGQGSNYGDLARYMTYNNCEREYGPAYPVFDYLYRDDTQRHRSALARISGCGSLNCFVKAACDALDGLLGRKPSMGYALHIPLSALVKDMELLNERERALVKRPRAYVQFLLFNRLDKLPAGAVLIDVGTAAQDCMRGIFQKLDLPLLWFRIGADEIGDAARLAAFRRTAEEEAQAFLEAL